MNRERLINAFLEEICRDFPELEVRMNLHDEAMTTSKMEEVAKATTEAIAGGNIELAKKYLSFMEGRLSQANSVEYEFIDVYFAENLFWGASSETIEKGWCLVPTKLKKLYVAFHGRSPKAGGLV